MRIVRCCLNRFLKEIAEFTYDDSEELGNAFEYLLSIMGSQGDAGQFRTPRHIIDMMVEITAPSKNETILDPACGTAGFLISAYSYIKKSNRNEQGKSTLTPDDMTQMTKNFAGYDISPDMVRLSRVNMYLHGFTNPNISEYDTLTSLEKWDDTYDVIFSNPPFMTPKGGITPHKRYRVSAKRAEVLFVDYIAEHLESKGRAAIIVPEGIVFQSQSAYKTLQKYLVEDWGLYGVISLPAGVFNPYSGVKTSILLIDKTLAKERDSILFVKLNNDGYDLGAQRREIKGSEIPDVINIFKDYQNGVNVEGRENVVLASKTAIAEQDYILVGERYKTAIINDTTWPLVKISDVCEINPRKSEINDLPPDTMVSFVPMAVVNEHQKQFIPTEEKPLSDVYTGYTYFRNGDVLLAKVTPCFENGKSGIAENLTNEIGFGSSEFFVLRPNKERVLSDFIYRLISTDLFINQGKQKMTGTGGLQRIPRDFLNDFMIPLPPLSVQEKIIDEIEGYQKIIDGARQVVENYKPTIKVDPAWETVELGSVATLLNGRAYKQDELLHDGKYPVLRVGNFFSNRDWYYSDLELEPEKYCDNGDLLFAWSASFGPKIWDGGKVIYHYHIWKIILTDSIDRDFLYYILFGLSETIKTQGHGIAMIHTTKGDMEKMLIPLPPIEIQKEIAFKTNEEAQIVGQNYRLIEIFQQKIRDRINEVWGE